jgi:hypothetical protein
MSGHPMQQTDGSNFETDEPADPAIVRDLFGLTLGDAKIAAIAGTSRLRMQPKNWESKQRPLAPF